MDKSRTIKVDYLARVEGEGALYVKVKGDQVVDCKLNIFEPPRFFEAFLRGRRYTEVPDITARICGICPIAYQMSSVRAMESALGVTVDGQLRELRRLIYCGEWIESHILHMFMLHAPDFLGYQDALQMAADFPEQVKLALKLKKLGNDLMTVLGGREIHPINMRVGGFYRAPDKAELLPFVEQLEWGRDATAEALRWVATLTFPELEHDYEFVSLSHPDEYPLFDGRLKSNKGLDIPIEDFDKHFEEEHVQHSTSLHCRVRERGYYMVGPLARYNNEYEKLPAVAREAARAIGLEPNCRNPFKSILVRGVETVFAFEEAIRIIRQYAKPARPFVPTEPRQSTGAGCSEAPRGICWHKYSMDNNGSITSARIVPPTSQNQGIIEDDLRRLIPGNLGLSDDDLTWRCEQAARNYDPCISCSCHFLRLNVERS